MKSPLDMMNPVAVWVPGLVAIERLLEGVKVTSYSSSTRTPVPPDQPLPEVTIVAFLLLSSFLSRMALYELPVWEIFAL